MRHRGTRMADEKEHELVETTTLTPDIVTALTPAALARSGASVERLHQMLLGAGLSVDAYTVALTNIHTYVNNHPEQVDVVRLLGGDEHDLVTALLTQWFEAQTQPAQAVMIDGSPPDDADAQPANVVSLTQRRRSRQYAQRRSR